MLLSLLAIGGAASFSVSGTYAILTSAMTSKGSSIASGTLTFGNQVNTGTTCYSYGSGSSNNTNSSCSALVSNSTLRYPGSSASATVTITNNGSVGIGDLQVYMPSCSGQASPGAGAQAGGGDPCGYLYGGGQWTGLLFSIEETSTPGGTPTYCWYPDQAAGACSGSSYDWLAFMSGFSSVSNALDFGAGPASGQARYFTITVGLPSQADPTLQGEEALFSLAWHVTS